MEEHVNLLGQELEAKVLTLESAIDTDTFTPDMLQFLEAVNEADLGNILKRFFTGFYARRKKALKQREDFDDTLRDLIVDLRDLDELSGDFRLTQVSREKLAHRLVAPVYALGFKDMEAHTLVDVSEKLSTFNTKKIGEEVRDYLTSRTDKSTMVEDNNGIKTIIKNPSKYFGRFDKLVTIVGKSNRGFFKTKVLGWKNPGLILSQVIGLTPGSVVTLVATQDKDKNIKGHLIKSQFDKGLIRKLSNFRTYPNAEELVSISKNIIKFLDESSLMIEDVDDAINVIDNFESMFDGSEHYAERLSYTRNVLPKLIQASIIDLKGRNSLAETFILLGKSYLAALTRNSKGIKESEIPNIVWEQDTSMAPFINASEDDKHAFEVFEVLPTPKEVLTAVESGLDEVFAGPTSKVLATEADELEVLFDELDKVNKLKLEQENGKCDIDLVKMKLLPIAESNNIEFDLQGIQDHDALKVATESIIDSIIKFIKRIMDALFGKTDSGSSSKEEYKAVKVIEKKKEVVDKAIGRHLEAIRSKLDENSKELLARLEWDLRTKIFIKHYPLIYMMSQNNTDADMLAKTREMRHFLHSPIYTKSIEEALNKGTKWSTIRFLSHNTPRNNVIERFPLLRTVTEDMKVLTGGNMNNFLFSIGSDSFSYLVTNDTEDPKAPPFSLVTQKINFRTIIPTFQVESDSDVAEVIISINDKSLPAISGFFKELSGDSLDEKLAGMTDVLQTGFVAGLGKALIEISDRMRKLREYEVSKYGDYTDDMLELNSLMETLQDEDLSDHAFLSKFFDVTREHYESVSNKSLKTINRDILRKLKDSN